MNRLEEAQAVLAQADCVCSTGQVAAAYDALAEKIRADYATLNPLMLVVMIGGLVPAAEIFKRLDFAFEVDYLHATRYQGATSGGRLVWRRRPDVALAGRHVLVIDDILDGGHTLIAVRDELQALQPASLKVAVLCEKLGVARPPSAFAEFIGLQVPNRYVFGCGMDYKEYWRQLPAIYAMREAQSSSQEKQFPFSGEAP